MPSMLASHDPVKSFFSSIKMIKNSKEIFNDFLCNLATGLVTIINLYSPNAIILGGGIMNSSDIFLNELKEIISEKAFVVSGIECSIEKQPWKLRTFIRTAFLPKNGELMKNPYENLISENFEEYEGDFMTVITFLIPENQIKPGTIDWLKISKRKTF